MDLTAEIKISENVLSLLGALYFAACLSLELDSNFICLQSIFQAAGMT